MKIPQKHSKHLNKLIFDYKKTLKLDKKNQNKIK